MASGDTLLTFTPLANMPPASSYATFDTRNSHAVLDFDAAADEAAIFGDVLPRHYSGGGLTVTLAWAASTATTGNVVWAVSIERLQDDVDDTDADSFATAQTVTAACASASGELSYDAVTFTSGAQMDSLAVGEAFRIKVQRTGSSGSDTMTGDAELFRVEIRET
jgi:hypothetical protein